MTDLFAPLPFETRTALARLPASIDKVFPLPSRFRAGLPGNVAELSRLFTFARKERGASYLGKPPLLSAYLRYFLPWNVFRLTQLLSSLPLELKPNDAVNDIGAGPLTFAIALWLSRPDLRTIPLEFRCVDRTSAVLDAGKKLFAAISGARSGARSGANSGAKGGANSGVNCPWTVKTIKGELSHNGRLSVEIRGKPAALTVAANIYNELFWDFSPHDTEELERFAEKQARLLSSLTDTSGAILVVEPGIPRSGEFMSRLRFRLMNEGRSPIAPCTHSSRCPMPGGGASGGARDGAGSGASSGGNNRTGGKGRWCHFAFDTTGAPKELHKLAAAAQIPKERAVLSFILSGPIKGESKGEGEKIRIVSDAFPVNKHNASWGRYGCCKSGLVLVTGSKAAIDSTSSGVLEELPLASGRIDSKSGALIAVKS